VARDQPDHAGRDTAADGQRERQTPATALIAGQIALTLLLMTAAGAAIQGFIRMNTAPLGHEPQHVMPVVILIGEDAHTTRADRARFQP
jgi:hypothetical protein